LKQFGRIRRVARPADNVTLYPAALLTWRVQKLVCCTGEAK
jgi:hypothetical protein